jgi:hypothetical protein
MTAVLMADDKKHTTASYMAATNSVLKQAPPSRRSFLKALGTNCLA